MNDVGFLIDKYGPEISKQLKIASSFVYEKMIWYVQMNGLIQVINGVLLVVFAIIFSFICHKFFKKWRFYKDAELIPVAFFGWILGLLIFGGIVVGVGGTVEEGLIKFIIPQYWIIDQVIQKTVTK